MLTQTGSGDGPGGQVLRLLDPLLDHAVGRIKLNRTGALIVDFGVRELKVFPVYSGPDDRYNSWAVWTPSKKYIRVGPGARVRIEEEADTQ